jgi:hypothetical protein
VIPPLVPGHVFGDLGASIWPGWSGPHLPDPHLVGLQVPSPLWSLSTHLNPILVSEPCNFTDHIIGARFLLFQKTLSRGVAPVCKE